MYRVFLLLGSNLGDRYRNLEDAAHAINELAGQIVRKSSIYSTAAWGKTEQPDFYNQALEVLSRGEPDALLEIVLSIEKALGRVRREKWGERLIDIDILLYGDLVIRTTPLTVPHPEMQNRRFALEPLAEIAGSVMHPVFNKTIDTLLAECADTLPVKRIDGKEV